MQRIIPSFPTIREEFENNSMGTFSLTLSEVDVSDIPSDLESANNNLEKTFMIEEISNNEVDDILKRLPEIEHEASDKMEFYMKKSSLKPPTSGNTIATSFPPESDNLPEVKVDPKLLEKITKEQAPPLVIERHSPQQGDISHPVVDISLTFNQSMISISSREDLLDKIPVILEPKVEGEWKWSDTFTLQFKPEKNRLPFATEYQIKVPAGTTSIIGGKLSTDFILKFSTSPPQVVSFFPYEQTVVQTLRPIMTISFNQKIDPSQVLKAIKITSRSTYTELELVPESEVERIRNIDNEIFLQPHLPKPQELVNDYFFRFRPMHDLPKAETIFIHIGPGVQSLEGSRKSTSEELKSFQTYSEFTISPQENNYLPGSNWFISFNNPIDWTTLKKEMIKVSPEVDGLEVSISPKSNHIQIINRSKPETTYTVIFSQELQDIHGQKLTNNQCSVTTMPMNYFGNISGPSEMIILDSSFASPQYSFVVTNYDKLRIRIWQVTPSDYNQIPHYVSEVVNNQRGKLVSDKEVVVQMELGVPRSFDVDLMDALQHPHEKLGHVFVVVEPTYEAFSKYGTGNYEYRTVLSCWIQITNLSLDVFTSQSELESFAHVWVTTLKDGRPVEGTEVEIITQGSKGQTDPHGLVSLKAHNENRGIIQAKLNNDTTFIPNVFFVNKSDQNIIAHIFDDRGLYKPKETVSIKGYVRKMAIEKSKIVPQYMRGNIHYKVTDKMGVEINSGILSLNEFGAFFLQFTLPIDINLGQCNMIFTPEFKSPQFYHFFRVEEFRKPEYEVSSSNFPSGPHFTAEKTEGVVYASTHAAYYAGGALSDAQVRWNVTAIAATYNPPGWGEYTFGVREPWWFGIWRNLTKNLGMWSFTSKTDSLGDHRLKIKFNGITNPPKPLTLSARALIQDLNAQAQETTTSFLVHPSSLYIGFKLNKSFGKVDEEQHLYIVVCNIDGKLIADVPFELCFTLNGRKEEKDENGLLKYKDFTTHQKISLKSSSSPLEYKWIPKEGGTYTISVSVYDSKERKNFSSLSNFHVQGGSTTINAAQHPVNSVVQESVTLIPSQQKYSPGETMELMIQSPFAPAQGIFIITTDEIVHLEYFEMKSKSQTLTILIKEEWLPNITASVSIAGNKSSITPEGKEDMSKPFRPAFAVGSIGIEISLDIRTLTVDILPDQKEATPGAESTIYVHVLDWKGNPVEGCEVALIVVDESILGVTGYTIGNPLSVFYHNRMANNFSRHLREKVFLQSKENLEAYFQQHNYQNQMFNHSRKGTGASFGYVFPTSFLSSTVSPLEQGMPEPQGIVVRTNFNPLANFSSSLITDRIGSCKATFKLPDSLTRYRIWAIAATSILYGKGESHLSVKLPLMVRPSPPRFLNFGDKASIPVVLQNQTKDPLVIKTAARFHNADLDGIKGYKIWLAANSRVSIKFDCKTTSPGVARFQVVSVSSNGTSNLADAVEGNIPVYTPATTEAFATYGNIGQEDTIVQSIKTPTNIFKQFGGLKISTSSTALHSLTDAVLYLCNYPYDCCEQIASRTMGIIGMKDILQAFKIKDLQSTTEIELRIVQDLRDISKRQNNDGGFGMWSNMGSIPFVSVHVGNCLARAIERGFKADRTVVSRNINYLQNIETHLQQYSWYSHCSQVAIIAYSLSVRARYGQDVSNEAINLLKKYDMEKDFSLESLGWILSAVQKQRNSLAEFVHQIMNYLKTNVNETSDTANFITGYGDDGQLVMLHSNRRTDGVLLEALLQTDPMNTLVPKIATGLLKNRKKGRWNNTQENCFILLALDTYFRIYEKDIPDFVAGIWLGDNYAGESSFKGRTATTYELEIPMRYIPQGEQNLVIHKNGQGRLYYRIGMSYSLENLELKSANFGFIIERTYQGIDSPDHVTRDLNGVYHFKLGEQIRVKLTMTALSRRYNVILTDKLPGGLEIINPALKGSPQPISQVSSPLMFRQWDPLYWFEHQNLRDERAEAFKSLLWEGRYEYQYITRATTAGEFVVPPAKAEEMYNPEVFGRTGTDKVIIE